MDIYPLCFHNARNARSTLSRCVWRPLFAPWTVRPHILFTASSLILPANESEPLRLAFSLVNRGDANGTVTIKDRTYCFSVDPSEKSFKYLPRSPQEISVPALPNTHYKGEMRFDFRFTPEKLVALKSGKARLFFFALGEYRDGSNKTYPLPFSAMYDPYFPGNLIAAPKDMIFE
jgi:hypothetical protein